MIDEVLATELQRTFAAALDTDPGKARERLLDAGWLEALAHDEGLAVSALFRAQGASGHDAAALDDVLVNRLAGRVPMPAGDVAVAYPVRRSTRGPSPARVLLPGRQSIRHVLWIPGPDGDSFQFVEIDGPMHARAVRGIDRDFGLLGLEVPPSGRATSLEGAEAQWPETLAAGRVALCHQMNAGSRAVLSQASGYATSRSQFGQTIAGFQAVKHRLAETLVAIMAADAAAVGAASTSDPSAAAVAKALAGRAAKVTARHCLQVFGGIGFTLEHDFHNYLRRNLVLDRLLGDHQSIERELGAQVRTGAIGGRVVELSNSMGVGLLEDPATRH